MIDIETARSLVAAVASNMGLRVRVCGYDCRFVVESTRPDRNTVKTQATLDNDTGNWMVSTWIDREKHSREDFECISVPDEVGDAGLVATVLSEWVKETAKMLVAAGGN